MCGSHTMKAYRHSDPYWTAPPRYDDKTGQRYGLIVVIKRAQNKWECRCDCGATTRVNAGDLNRALRTGHKVSCGSSQHLRAANASPSYHAIHERLAADRGPASQHRCTDCGKLARQWSYDHQDPEGRNSEYGPYSPNQDHYQPRCVPCHKRFDLGWIRGQRSDSQTPMNGSSHKTHKQQRRGVAGGMAP